MENTIDNNIPFLTRFFRAWAEDLDLPEKDTPVITDEMNDSVDIESL